MALYDLIRPYLEVKLLRFSEVPKRGLKRPHMRFWNTFWEAQGGTHKGRKSVDAAVFSAEVKLHRFSEVPERGPRRPQIVVLGHFLGGSRGGGHKGRNSVDAAG